MELCVQLLVYIENKQVINVMYVVFSALNQNKKGEIHKKNSLILRSFITY